MDTLDSNIFEAGPGLTAALIDFELRTPVLSIPSTSLADLAGMQSNSLNAGGCP